MTAAISIKNLTKKYKDASNLALDSVSLEIPKGKIFGLLGPNGAGKSTIINILGGLVLKTEGDIKLAGYNLETDLKQAKFSIGIVPQELVLDPFFTPYEVLELQAGLFGLRKSERRTDELLKAVGLFDKKNAQARRLSGGMKRRLMVAKAMVHDPDILVLDEPTAGVDIELRKNLWDYVRALHKRGKTIIFTTHYLEEAEALCEEIAIINKGKVIACEPIKKLLKVIDQKVLFITAKDKIMKIPDSLNAYEACLKEDSVLCIKFKPSVMDGYDIIKKVAESGIEIKDIATEEGDLEDVFLELTRA